MNFGQNFLCIKARWFVNKDPKRVTGGTRASGAVALTLGVQAGRARSTRRCCEEDPKHPSSKKQTAAATARGAAGHPRSQQRQQHQAQHGTKSPAAQSKSSSRRQVTKSCGLVRFWSTGSHMRPIHVTVALSLPLRNGPPHTHTHTARGSMRILYPLRRSLDHGSRC